MRLLEVRLNAEGLCIKVLDLEVLLDSGWLPGNEALTEVEHCRVEFDTRLACQSSQIEVVFRTTDDVQGALVVLKRVLCNWQINQVNLDFSAFLNSTSIRDNSHIFVDLSLPHEIEVEFSVVLEYHFANFSLVYKEFAEVNWARRRRASEWLRHFDSWFTGKDLVVDLISFTFNVEHERTGLSLNVAG